MKTTQLDLAVVANSFAAIVLAFAAASGAGCKSNKNPLKLGEKFPVCINANERIVLRESNAGPDFDVVNIAIDGISVEVVIGWHPQFSNAQVKNSVEAKKRLAYLGKERIENKDRILWGFNRHELSGPIFVEFSAPELKSIEQVLSDKNLLVSCNIEAWEKTRRRDVRPVAS